MEILFIDSLSLLLNKWVLSYQCWKLCPTLTDYDIFLDCLSECSAPCEKGMFEVQPCSEKEQKICKGKIFLDLVLNMFTNNKSLTNFWMTF